jgi:hypothetical protein
MTIREAIKQDIDYIRRAKACGDVNSEKFGIFSLKRDLGIRKIFMELEIYG